jgi:hypothetical protein
MKWYFISIEDSLDSGENVVKKIAKSHYLTAKKITETKCYRNIFTIFKLIKHD